MISGERLYIKIGGEWIPATQADLIIDTTAEAFLLSYTIVELEDRLKRVIEKEDYEQAGVIHKIIEMKKADNGIG